METKKVFLTEDEIPRQWYNILADIKMNPPLGPDGNPVTPDQLAPVFPMNLIEQEVSTERWIDIPEEVLGILKIWRPSPLVRAYALEKALGITVTPEIRLLRRLLYCGEWIESHALHIHLLHAPDFLGYESGMSMAADHREAVEDRV